MAEIDSFGEYVRQRLEAWGREFALHRDCEYLGHKSKDLLQVLIEHRGEMPPRVVGFKPLETPPLEQQIEDIVYDIARFNVTRAIVLRAYYCGIGRRGVERYEQALVLLAAAGKERINRQRYFSEHELGVADVRSVLWGARMAA